MASGTNYNPSTSGNAGQVALDKFAAMMIDRMEQMKASDWKKGWIGGASGYAGLPQNVGAGTIPAPIRCSCNCIRRRMATTYLYI